MIGRAAGRGEQDYAARTEHHARAGLRPRRVAGSLPRPSGTSGCGPTATGSTSRSPAEYAHYLEDPYVEPDRTRRPARRRRRRGDRRRLRRADRRGPPAPGRHRRLPHHREGRRLRRHLVLEPISRAPSATSSPTSTCRLLEETGTCPRRSTSTPRRSWSTAARIADAIRTL